MRRAGILLAPVIPIIPRMIVEQFLATTTTLPEKINWTDVPGVSLKPGMFKAGVTAKPMGLLIAARSIF